MKNIDIEVPVMLTQNSVTIVNPKTGKASTISKGTKNFELVRQAIQAKKYQRALDLIDMQTAAKTYLATEGSDVTIDNGVVYYGGKPCGNLVATRILQFMEQALDPKPLVKFLKRMMLNPDERCRNSLYAFMESNEIPIDSQGNIVGYKSLQKNLTDWYSGSVKHRIGGLIRWGQRSNETLLTDVDYGQDCSNKGFHVGNHNYASTFGQSDRVLCLVRVDPAKVISVPSEGSMGKIRVAEYTVLAIFVGDKPISARVVSSKKIKRDGAASRKAQRRLKNGRFASKR